MPERKAPYTRGYSQTKGRGHQPVVTCSFCGRTVPRHKCITQTRGFRITDPVLRRELDKHQVSGQVHKLYVCPSCARFHSIVKKRSDKPNYMGGRRRRLI